MRRGYNGIKFYDPTDLSCGHYLEKIEIILKAFSQEEAFKNINIVLELFNIEQFFNNNIYLKKWTDLELKEYKSIVKESVQTVAIFFKKINEQNFLNTFDGVDINYLDDFWCLIKRFKVYERISSEIFSLVLDQQDFQMRHLLKQKVIVEYYGSAIADYMRKSTDSAELLMSQFLEEHLLPQPTLWFPKELTGEDRAEIIWRYIVSGEAKPNYLKLFAEAQTSIELPIQDKAKLEARKRYDGYVKSLLSNNSGIIYRTEVCFSRTQKEEMLYSYNFDVHEVSVSYSTKWIENNRDYPTLWNNFIYLFQYVDRFCRSQFVSQPSQISAFEMAIGRKGKKDYFTGMDFDMNHNLFNLQMRGYCRELSRLNIKLESLFKWFFEEYLNDEFQAKDFIFSVPSDGTTYLEKCKLLASEIDSALKQFRLFATEGQIDRELLQISSEHTKLEEVPSFFKNKYIYPNNDLCKGCMNLLFSDQSALSYNMKTNNDYENLFSLLYSETVNLADFAEWQRNDIDWLSQHCVIRIEESGTLMLNLEKALVLKDLYYNQVSCLHYLEHFRGLLYDMVKSDEIRYEASLFSKPEQSYINYILNRAEFSNGYDLRNKYIHGTHSLKKEDHEKDYVELLKIMVLIILKINEEFCLRNNDNKNV